MGPTVKILFDKEKSDQKFQTGWGLAYLVGDDLLFDTGENFAYLKKNARLMRIDLQQIKTVVISHNHWDHAGGLWGLLKENSNVSVYGCRHFGDEFEEKVRKTGATFHEVRAFHRLGDTIQCGQRLPERSFCFHFHRWLS